PAGIAGCETIVLATPPRSDGSICPEVLYCTKKAGEAQALESIFSLLLHILIFGTVDKILGPGNQYVTAAKMLLQNRESMISINMPAGPSEVLVIADKNANAIHVGASLGSRASQ
ncbi:hypothetical protein SELMODRAFT_106882, partial [Selaginella moellendorffii]